MTTTATTTRGRGFLGSEGEPGDILIDACKVQLRVTFDREDFPDLEVETAEVSIPLGPDDDENWIVRTTPASLSREQSAQLIHKTLRLSPGFARSVSEVKAAFEKSLQRRGSR